MQRWNLRRGGTTTGRGLFVWQVMDKMSMTYSAFYEIFLSFKLRAEQNAIWIMYRTSFRFLAEVPSAFQACLLIKGIGQRTYNLLLNAFKYTPRTGWCGADYSFREAMVDEGKQIRLKIPQVSQWSGDSKRNRNELLFIKRFMQSNFRWQYRCRLHWPWTSSGT